MKFSIYKDKSKYLGVALIICLSFLIANCFGMILSGSLKVLTPEVNGLWADYGVEPAVSYQETISMGGESEELTMYEIGKPEELAWFLTDKCNVSFVGVKLVKDIDLAGHEWSGIGRNKLCLESTEGHIELQFSKGRDIQFPTSRAMLDCLHQLWQAGFTMLCLKMCI